MSNEEKFAQAYAVHLADCIAQRPDMYSYPVTEVPSVVPKMVAALKAGRANVSSLALKRTCNELGVRGTITALAEYLNAPENLPDASTTPQQPK